MAEPPSESHGRKGMRKRAVNTSRHDHVAAAGSEESSAPCGACKFLRRKCINGCIFAPHFGSDQGAAKFAAVHKVFGASNVSKILLHIPVNRRHDAVLTISYEAQARLSDPVYGCVSIILAMQQQVANLQAELAVVQSQVMGSRIALANSLHSTNLQQQNHFMGMFPAAAPQPTYSNNSTASNNLLNIAAAGYNSNYESGTAGPYGFEPSLHLSQPRGFDDDDDDEQQSGNQLPFGIL